MPAGGRRRPAPIWWGFHRLTDDWARRLVGAAGTGRGDLVLDVGAGTGALTAPLVAAGARVVAIELDPERVRALRRRFAAAAVTVVCADGADLRLPRRPFHVVANPPFAVTNGLLRRLLAPGSRLVRADLVVPAHVARRWTGDGAPGVHRWRHMYAADVTLRVPRRAFRPPPPNDAVVLSLERRGERPGEPPTNERDPRGRRRTRGG